MSGISRASLFLCLLAVITGSSAAVAELPLVFSDDFEHGMDHWQTTDPDPAKSVWEVIETRGPADKLTKVLRVTGPSSYEPPVRSPLSIALVKDVVVRDFDMTVELQNTRPDAGPHRDLCLFWGYQDPSHFYYVHLGAKSDPNACQIFIVNDKPRTPITTSAATSAARIRPTAMAAVSFHSTVGVPFSRR